MARTKLSPRARLGQAYAALRGTTGDSDQMVVADTGLVLSDLDRRVASLEWWREYDEKRQRGEQ